MAILAYTIAFSAGHPLPSYIINKNSQTVKKGTVHAKKTA